MKTPIAFPSGRSPRPECAELRRQLDQLVRIYPRLSPRVQRSLCGTIEQLVWLLVKELSRLGHEVTVFAAAGSETCGKLVATLHAPIGW